jgi:hypothetical protein
MARITPWPTRFGAQRVAFALGAGMPQHRADIGFELAQFPFAGVRDLEAEAFGLHLDLEFVVLDQAQASQLSGPADARRRRAARTPGASAGRRRLVEGERKRAACG